MIRTLSTFILILLTLTTSLKSSASGIVQQIAVTNSLWNVNATSGAPGITQLAATVAFNNGGARPCYTTTLSFSHAVTILVGTGQPCSTAVTSVSVTPASVFQGTIFTTPADATIDNVNYSFQVTIADGGDPVFDMTNGMIDTPGVTLVTVVGSPAR